jgi:hypothetical protein
MSSNNCLNCGNELNNKFCSQCGQKADTHRITVRHFVEHDLLHGVFHIEKGILFTIKETFTRPGKAAMDYIQGKRISYYNIFYLLLVLIGLNILVVHYAQEIHHQEVIKAERDGLKLINFFKANIKYLILSFIPLFAINGWIIFRRLKLNFAEHHILSGFVLLGCTLIGLFMNLIKFLPVSWQEGFLAYLELALLFILLLFPVYVYYMAFGPKYKVSGFSWRMLLMYVLFFLEAIFFLIIIVLVISKGNFEGSLMMK